MRRRNSITLLGGATTEAWRLRVRAPQLPKMLWGALLATHTLFATPLVGEAQQSKTIPRLCFLSFGPDTLQSQSPRFDAFFDGLRDLGYVNEGPSPLTTFPRTVVVSGFPRWLPNVCASMRTSSP